MAKKPYRRYNQSHHTKPHSNMVAIPYEKFEALVKAHTEISIVRLYLQESITTYVDVDNIRLILGIQKGG